GGLGFGQVTGQDGELSSFHAGGALRAGGAGAAVGGGEGGHGSGLAFLGARCPGCAGLALRAGDGLAVVVDGEVSAGIATRGAGLGAGVGQQRPNNRILAGGWARSARVADAMLAVPRDEFVPDAPVEYAYDDRAVIIKRDPHGAALSCASEPAIVAMM